MQAIILNALFVFVSTVLVGFATYYGSVFSKYIVQKHMGLKALEAVRYAEETFKIMGGSEKFTHAMSYLSNDLKSVGIKNVDEMKLKGLIQAAYNVMKTELVTTVNESTPPTTTPTPTIGTTPAQPMPTNGGQ